MLLAALVVAGIAPSVGRAQQNPTNTPSGSYGGTASRFIPLDVWTRMLERPEAAPDAALVEANGDSAWSAMEGVLKQLDVPITFSDKLAGEMGTVRAKLYKRIGKQAISSYLRCGEGAAGPNADMYVVYVSVVAFVRPAAAGKYLLNAMISGQAVDLPNGRNDTVDCTSSGAFETKVMKEVTKRLTLAKPKT